MSDLPMMPLFVDAYRTDTTHLTVEEHGAYLLLMMEAWRRPTCALPDDDKLICRMLGITPARWAKLKPTVMGFWDYDGRSKHWVQKRMRKERDYVEKNRAKKRDAAAKRWKIDKNSNAGAYAGALQPQPQPQPQRLSEETVPKEGTYGGTVGDARGSLAVLPGGRHA